MTAALCSLGGAAVGWMRLSGQGQSGKKLRKEGVFVRQPLVGCGNCAQSFYSDCESHT